MKLQKMLLWAVIAPVAVFAMACSDDSDSLTSATALPANVQLRVAHLSPDAPNVDVIVNGDTVLSDVPFTAVSDYLSVPAGEYDIQVTAAGDPSAVVIDATVTLNANTNYTVAATGFLADIQPVIYVDDLSTGAGARIRFIHASPDAPEVTIAVSDGGPVLFRNIEFQEASRYVEVDGGTYDLDVRIARSMTVALEVPGVDVMGGVTYTVFAIGSAADGSLSALPVVDAQ